MDLTADDWARTPWTYPGTPAPHGGLLHDGDFLPLTPGPGPLGDAGIGGTALDERLAEAGVAGSQARRLVVAVGSNASPAVMARKLTAAQVSTTVPFVAVEVHGLSVGHSAHVSTRGFFPAAPFRTDSALTRTFASLLDDEQLAALDRTEPNYLRRTVARSACTAEVAGGHRPSTFMVYDSRWGVLGPPAHPPWPLTAQEDLLGRLRQHCVAFSDAVAALSGPREVLAGLAADTGLRTRVREMLQDSAWARSSGLETGQSAG